MNVGVSLLDDAGEKGGGGTDGRNERERQTDRQRELELENFILQGL